MAKASKAAAATKAAPAKKAAAAKKVAPVREPAAAKKTAGIQYTTLQYLTRQDLEDAELIAYDRWRDKQQGSAKTIINFVAVISREEYEAFKADTNG